MASPQLELCTESWPVVVTVAYQRQVDPGDPEVGLRRRVVVEILRTTWPDGTPVVLPPSTEREIAEALEEDLG